MSGNAGGEAFAITQVEVVPFRLRLHRPLKTARGTIVARDGVVLVLGDDDGQQGYGEACPLPGFAIGATGIARSCARALASAKQLCGGIRTPMEWLEVGRGRFAAELDALAAFDTAVRDLAARRAGRPLAEMLARAGSPPRRRVEVNALVSIGTIEEVARAGRRARDAGHRTVKLKLGGGSGDLDCARALREAIGVECALRLDANGSWAVDEAIRRLEALAPLAIEYVEQPVAPGHLDALARVRNASPIPIAADEDATHPDAAMEVIARRAADWIVLKPTLGGGIGISTEIAGCARAAGIGVVITSSLESAVGRAAALHFASALDPAPVASGLATGAIFERDLADLAEPREGLIRLPEGPGLGIEPRFHPSDSGARSVFRWT